MLVRRWYAAYTYPHAEKIVSEHLAYRGVEHFLPTYHKTSRWKNRLKVELELPLFPGYVFVNIALSNRLSVLQVPSVCSLCGGMKPTPLRTIEIEILRAGISRLSVEPHPFLAVGDRVRVRSGPLAGLEGFLVQKKNSSRFVLSMDIILQSMSVEIDACDLEPLSNSRGLSILDTPYHCN